MRKRKALPPPRPRTRALLVGNRVLSGGSYQWLTSQGNQPATPVDPLVVATTKRTDDIVTPGYKQLVANGHLVNNPYSSVSRKITGGDTGDYTIEWNGPVNQATLVNTGYGFRDACGYMTDGFTPPLPNYYNLVRYTQTKALSGVEAASLQTGVAVGEFAETMRMLVSPLRGLTNWLVRADRQYKRDLKAYGRKALETKSKVRTDRYRMKLLRANAKGLDKETRSLLERYISGGNNAADVVLSYNLGWKPFLSDIDTLLHKIPSLQVVERRWSRATRDQDFDTSDSYSNSMSTALAKIDTNTKTSVKVRAGVLYADRFEVSHHFGTRLADVPETVWELIPFSFLVDYVVNVGDYLGALRARAYSNIQLFYTTEEIECTHTREWAGITDTIYHPWTACTGSVKSWTAGAPEVLIFKAKSRRPDPFGPSLERVVFSHERPAAQLQNVLGLAIKALTSVR